MVTPNRRQDLELSLGYSAAEPILFSELIKFLTAEKETAVAAAYAANPLFAPNNNAQKQQTYNRQHHAFATTMAP